MYEINDYQDYMIFLNNRLYSNGGMTDQNIIDMLKSNALTERFGITIYDVKKDIRTLSSFEEKSELLISLQGGTPGKVKSKPYATMIAEWAKITNRLTIKKMNDLIKTNRLNVSAADVAADIREYIANKKSNTASVLPMTKSNPIVHNNIAATSVNNKPIKASTKVESSQKKSVVYDTEMVNDVRRLLEKYPDLVEDAKKVRSALADIFPGKKMEVNLLSELVENGILHEIKKADILDGVMCNKYASILEDNFGTASEVAIKIVLVWFHGYGRLICNKKIRE